MPEFLEDPSVLTKEKLKGELLANKVPLPSGDQKKDVYVKLYKKYLTVRNKNPENFSSDDEADTVVTVRSRIGTRKSTKKPDKPRGEEKEEFDVREMSNEELKEQLIKNGINPGPITESTRKVYEKRLQKLVVQEPVVKFSKSAQLLQSTEDRKQNGSTDSDQYSDNEEEGTKTDVKVDKRETLKIKSRASVTVRQGRSEHNPVETVKPASSGDSLIEQSSCVKGNLAPSISHVPGSTEQDAVTASKTSGSLEHIPAPPSVSESFRLSRRTPVTRYEVIEKTEREERTAGRNILREMFPHEVQTPTGISATCRKPIRGAAGRPVEPGELGEFKLEESVLTKSFTKAVPSAEIKETKMKSRRSVPIWVQILLLAFVAIFLFLVYEAMETNEGNPFTAFLGSSESSGTSE